MIESIIRYIVYYLEAAFLKPLYFLLPFLAAIGIGGYVIMNLPKTYSSEATLVIEFQPISASLLSSPVSNDRLKFIEQRVLVRDNLLALADRFNLFPEARWTLSKTAAADLIRRHIYLRTDLNEAPDRSVSSASVHVGFEDSDPQRAADVTRELVAMIVEAHKRLRASRASEATNFLMREVDQLTARLSEREAVWTRYMEENRDAQPSRVPALLIDLQAKNNELMVLDQGMIALNEEANLAQAQLQLTTQQSTRASQLRSQLADLQAELAQKALTYSEFHPQIQLLKRKIEELRSRTEPAASAAGETAAAASKPLPPELGLLTTRISNAKERQQANLELRHRLTDQIASLKATVARATEVETQINAIQAERQILTHSLEEMRGRLDAARLGERLEQENAAAYLEVVEQPEVPKWARGPRRLVLLLALGMLSIGAGVVGLLFGDVLNRTIRGAFDLEKALQGQTLLMIPRWKPKDPRQGKVIAR